MIPSVGALVCKAEEQATARGEEYSPSQLLRMARRVRDRWAREVAPLPELDGEVLRRTLEFGDPTGEEAVRRILEGLRES